MGIFGQLGDPVTAAAACLCQHHGAAYAEDIGQSLWGNIQVSFNPVADATIIISTPITITERCCVVVNAAMMGLDTYPATDFEIERPQGTIRTTQESRIASSQMELLHHAAWEVLDPGTYTYYLMNRSGALRYIFAAWIKAVASDCEG